jgi:hypothetical protein
MADTSLTPVGVAREGRSAAGEARVDLTTALRVAADVEDEVLARRLAEGR